MAPWEQVKAWSNTELTSFLPPIDLEAGRGEIQEEQHSRVSKNWRVHQSRTYFELNVPDFKNVFVCVNTPLVQHYTPGW